MKKKQIRKLHLPKETLLYLTWQETGEAAGGVMTQSCYCSKVCTSNNNTARAGECCL